MGSRKEDSLIVKTKEVTLEHPSQKLNRTPHEQSFQRHTVSSCQKVTSNRGHQDGIFKTMPLIDHSKLIKTIDSDDGPEYEGHPNYRLLNLEKKFQSSKQKHRDILVNMSKKLDYLRSTNFDQEDRIKQIYNEKREAQANLDEL